MTKNTNTPETPENGSVMETGAVAIVGNNVKGVMVGGVAYDVVQAVNLPTLTQDTGQTIAVRFDLPIKAEAQYKEKEVTINGVKQVVTEESIINIARVTELSTGQQFNYVCNAITAANMRDAYPNDTYVGKHFAIKKLGVVAGKRYKEVQIVEIQPRT